MVALNEFRVLAAASKVFKVMFYGELKEEGDIKVCNVTAAAFEEFLQFFYLKEVILSMQHILEVSHLGHKYDIEKCFDVCVKFIKDEISADNVCIGLGFAILYDQNDLMKICEKKIIINTNAVFKSTSFLECDGKVLAHILNMRLLSCTEIDVFEGCMSWLKVKCGQQTLTKEMIHTHLGELFHQIRFVSLTIEEFAILVQTYGLLFSSEEYQDIISTIVLSKSHANIFNGNRRQIQWNNDTVIKCDRTISDTSSTFCMRNIETSIFSTNDPILLGAFICPKVYLLGKYGFYKLSELKSDVQIIESAAADASHPDSVRTVLCRLETKLQSSSETIVSLATPLLIRPGFLYEIRLSQQVYEHAFCGCRLIFDAFCEPILTFWNDMITKNGKQTRAFVTQFEFNRI